MKIAYLQFDVIYKNPLENIKIILKYITNNKANVFVTPELCLTGYLFSSKDELIELLTNNDNYFKIFIDICAQNCCSLILGHASFENGKIYNTVFVINGNGIIGKYSKFHLSKIEHSLFSEGKEIPLFIIDNVKIGINICYDLWVPEISRILFKQKAQVICCPCNFGGPWTYDIARTRSMENKMYYIIANRIGSEKINNIEAHFRGESKAFDYNGNIATKLKSREEIGYIEIDESIAENKETLMSRDISYEANKYHISIKSLTTGST